MTDMTEDLTEPRGHPVTILSRPVWGHLSFSLEKLQEWRDSIIEQAAQLTTQGGGLVILAYTAAHEPSVLLLLSFLLGRLKRQGRQAALYRAGLDSALPEEVLNANYLLIHRLPCCDGILNLLEKERRSGQVVIATGIQEEWEQLSAKVIPSFYQSLPAVGEKENVLDFTIEAELTEYRGLGPDAKAYLFVALGDAWGIPLPFALLARALGRDEDEVGVLIEEAQAKDLLFWIELEKPPALLVSTKAPMIARAIVGKLGNEATIQEGYNTLIRAVDPEEKDERYTILKLCQALLRGRHQWDDLRWGIQKPSRQWLLEMMRTHRTAIDAIWRQGDVIEKLLWGKLFEELRLFEQSNQAFLAGLMREPRNIALLQSRARMLGAWAQTSSEKYEEARAVFGRAASIAPQNPYVWQAWGVMEAEHFNPQDAQNYFRRAWQAVRQGREQLYTLVAWANLAIEEGQRQQARRLLADAQTLFPQNFYIRHLDGKLAFYEGRYLEAETHLQAVLQLDHGNLPALNTLGYMALKRGHWYKAERYLTRALAIDPDNVPTVHALAEVWAERGELAAALGQVEEARKCFQEAEQRFTQLLELEPHNRYTQVAYGVMLGKWATYDPQRYAQAEHLLRTVFECDPRNLFAHHAQGELQLRLGAFDEAERLFRGIRSQNPRNFRAHLLALLALARLKTIQGLAPEARQFLEQVKRMVDDIRAGRIPLPPFHDLIRTYNTWAAIEAEAGEVERAGEIVREALSYDPENAYTCRLYAALLDRLGKTEEAQRSRERAAELTTAQ